MPPPRRVRPFPLRLNIAMSLSTRARSPGPSPPVPCRPGSRSPDTAIRGRAAPHAHRDRDHRELGQKQALPRATRLNSRPLLEVHRWLAVRPARSDRRDARALSLPLTGYPAHNKMQQDLCASPPLYSRFPAPVRRAARSVQSRAAQLVDRAFHQSRAPADSRDATWKARAPWPTPPHLQIGLTRVNAAGTYAFVDVSIARNATPGPHPLRLVTAGGEATAPFEVLEPLPRAGRFQGFSPDDIIYLIMPDRFANGDPSNDDPAISRGLFNRAEAALLPRRRFPGHHRSSSVSQGSRRHRPLDQPGLRQCQPVEPARALRQQGHHRLSRLWRGRFLRRG